MEKIKGIITAVSQKEGKYGIAMGTGNWYNGFGKTEVNKGDEVEITYELNETNSGTFKNIDQIYVLKKAEPTAVGLVTYGTGPSDSNKYNMQMSKLKNKTNAKICALTCATNLSERGTIPEEVLALANQFNDWIYKEE